MKTALIFIQGPITLEEHELSFFYFEQKPYLFKDFEAELKKSLYADELEVVIDTPGGNTTAGLKIYHALKDCGKKVRTIAINANSIGSIIFLAGHERLMLKTAQMVIHNAWIDGLLFSDTQLNQYELERLYMEAKKEDEKLLDIYCSVAGEEKRQEIEMLMMKETALTVEKALELNFATGVLEEYGDMEIGNNRQIFAYTYNHYQILKNQTVMNQEKLKSLEKGFKALMNLFKGSFKNMVIDLSGGTKIFVFTEDETLVGKKAVLADEEGNPTEELAPAGEHVLSDGRIITVDEQGIITKVSEAVEVLEEQIQNLKKENSNLQARLKEYEKKFNALKTEFEEFKKEIPGDDGKDNDRLKKISLEEYRKLPKSQKFLLNIINRKQHG